MKRFVLLAAGAAMATIPAFAGLTGNPALSHRVPVRVPVGAVPVRVTDVQIVRASAMSPSLGTTAVPAARPGILGVPWSSRVATGVPLSSRVTTGVSWSSRVTTGVPPTPPWPAARLPARAAPAAAARMTATAATTAMVAAETTVPATGECLAG